MYEYFTIIHIVHEEDKKSTRSVNIFGNECVPCIQLNRGKN